jgi:cytochrome c553
MSKTSILAAVLGAAFAIASSTVAADFPAWAYPVAGPAAPGTESPKDDGSARHVPDSTVSLTEKQFEAHVTTAADWHPEEHPQMPAIVSGGREPQVWACAYCHLPNGAGRPENASLAGLTQAYIKQQLADFKNGNRKGSEPNRAPQNFMIALAGALTEAEAAQAAAYFASLKPGSFVRVVEADTAPRSYVAGAMLARLPGGGTEPLGSRIIEMPEELARAENRDSRTPYVAFVPPGSIARGKALSTSGTAFRCTICHGADLRGIGDIPRLAGRSPSYLMRQLYDYKSGTRTGGSGLMKVVVAGLSQDDMVALAAYISSQSP